MQETPEIKHLNGRELRQERQRQDMLENIDEAIQRLREQGIRITKRSLAAELGCHENSLRAPYVKAFLANYREFQPKDETPITKNMTLEEALKRISYLEGELEHSRHNNRVLKEDNSKLRIERDNFELKYRKLLGQYQIDVGKKNNRL